VRPNQSWRTGAPRPFAPNTERGNSHDPCTEEIESGLDDRIMRKLIRISPASFGSRPSKT
jgi:hypothetical protein